jgi:hypothetical protein
MTATGLACAACGIELPPNSKFCNECGAPVTQVSRSAEYKQVTVLFADVVHSMDIAAAVGGSRPRSGTGRSAARAQARTSAVLGCGAASARLSLGLMRDLDQLGVVDPAGFWWRGPQMGLWLSPGLVQVVAQNLSTAGVAQL